MKEAQRRKVVERQRRMGENLQLLQPRPSFRAPSSMKLMRMLNLKEGQFSGDPDLQPDARLPSSVLITEVSDQRQKLS